MWPFITVLRTHHGLVVLLDSVTIRSLCMTLPTLMKLKTTHFRDQSNYKLAGAGSTAQAYGTMFFLSILISTPAIITTRACWVEFSASKQTDIGIVRITSFSVLSLHAVCELFPLLLA